MIFQIVRYDDAVETIMCGGILLAIFFVIYLYYSIGWYPLKRFFMSKKDLCTHCGKPLTFGGDSCKWCGEKVQVTDTYVKTKPQKKKYLLKRENICQDCGNEMEYIENLESWFCQTCRSYK